MSRLKGPAKSVGLGALLDATAHAAGLASFADLLAAPRSKTFAMWRQALMLVLREQRQMSYPEIGWLLQMDHTTVIHGCRRARKAYVENEGIWRFAVDELEQVAKIPNRCMMKEAYCVSPKEDVL